MGSKSILARAGLTSGWAQEVVLAALALAVGFGLMPILIFYTGSAILGRYEGASVTLVFDSLYQGLFEGSVASWGVVLGPYVLYLLFRALRFGWRMGRPA
jgi:hypothetical protein